MTQMELNCISTPLIGSEEFLALRGAVSCPGANCVTGIEGSQLNFVLAALAGETKRPLIVVTPTEQGASRIMEDLTQLLGGGVMLFPAREISFLRSAASSRELSMERLNALGLAATGRLRALVMSADAIMHPLMPREAFVKRIIHLREGDRMDPNGLMDLLIRAGYERVDVAEARGQCALRGGILDVYPIGRTNALRAEFFDDEIDSLRDFDVMTQRSVDRVGEAEIFPASELLLSPEEAGAGAARLLKAIKAARPLGRGPGARDRQKELEKEYELMPFDAFLKIIEEGEGAEDGGGEPLARAARPEREMRDEAALRTTLGRNFATRLDALKSGRCFPGAEALFPILLENSALLPDYFDNPILCMDAPERLRERCENRMLEFEEHIKAALERDEAVPEQAGLLRPYDELLARFRAYSTLLLLPFARSLNDMPVKSLVKFEGVGSTGYQGNVRELTRDLGKWREEKWRVAILAGGVARGQRMNRLLFEHGFDAPFRDPAPETLAPGEAAILAGSLARGFLFPTLRLAVVTEGDVFGASKQKGAVGRARSGDKLSAFTDLNVGDFVVHENHGIGRYMGTVRLASEGTFRDFLHIQYQGSDKLYVPTDQLDRVQKYIGSEGETPKLNRLSGGEWQKQKSRVRASIQEIAGELVKLYAQRAATQGHAFAPDTPWQRQFEDSFEYEETPDQLAAAEDIKRDMEKQQIMDRLLCGDVGYGKTEVALRAIFKCVMDSKQAALLAPTTILVQQHYATMLRRFDGFPVRVDTISRFRTAAEQKATLEKLKNGELDVIIGTHRLLGKDIKYRDLGLLVIDEEQRFGVKHKEAIKKIKKSVDVLTLSATPIPRTLHMSMVGIRDMSLLQTPPEERYPVQTYVVEYSDGLVRDAILRELSRGGQVYVLYNRVSTIEVMYQRLKKLVPEARIAIGHGQMREHALEDVMLDFYEGKYNVLLCTTIIEAGLDVPRANTLIVCDADRFGLAQLYQLRGRVGRSNRLAYAFLTVSPQKVLTENADKRLSAIREFTEFGSGFRVAMRDLEIRGTGNLLGSEQSGHMASVGYDLYVKMIEDTVRELRGDVKLGDIQTKVELKVDAYLPSDYVTGDVTRVEIYKKIASIQDRAGREDLTEELIDRFGDPTRPVMNLIEIAHLKALCQKIGIDGVSSKMGQIALHFSPAAEIDVVRLVSALKPFEKRVRLLAGKDSSLLYFDGKKGLEELLRGAVLMMEKIVSEVVTQ